MLLGLCDALWWWVGLLWVWLVGCGVGCGTYGRVCRLHVGGEHVAAVAASATFSCTRLSADMRV